VENAGVGGDRAVATSHERLKTNPVCEGLVIDLNSLEDADAGKCDPHGIGQLVLIRPRLRRSLKVHPV
jgi:hypothetical protein